MEYSGSELRPKPQAEVSFYLRLAPVGIGDRQSAVCGRPFCVNNSLANTLAIEGSQLLQQPIVPKQHRTTRSDRDAGFGYLRLPRPSLWSMLARAFVL